MAKFVLFRQHDGMQCGIACLQMVCCHYGKKYSLDYLSKICHATTEGVSMHGISEAAVVLGLNAICGKATVEQLITAQLPAILHWGQNHFVVLYKVKQRKRGKRLFYIADPGKGFLEYDASEFQSHWVSLMSNGEEKGVVMFLHPTPGFSEREQVLSENKRSFGFLFEYIKQYKQYFGQILLGALVGCLLQLIFPFLTQSIVDVGITHQNLSFIYLILLAQLMLYLSFFLLLFLLPLLLYLPICQLEFF